MNNITFVQMKTNLLSSKEAIFELGISYDGLSKAIQNGRIKRIIKIGKENFFHPDDIQAFKKRRGERYHAMQ